MIDLLANIEWMIGGVVALVALVFGVKRSAKKEVQNDIEHDQLQDFVERTDAGRKSVQDGRNSRLSPADRLRRNDGQW